MHADNTVIDRTLHKQARRGESLRAEGANLPASICNGPGSIALLRMDWWLKCRNVMIVAALVVQGAHAKRRCEQK